MINERDAQTFSESKASKTRAKRRWKKAEEKAKANQNGSELPCAKDFRLPKRLTKDRKELIEAFPEAMQALKKEEAKYGKKDYSIF